MNPAFKGRLWLLTPLALSITLHASLMGGLISWGPSNASSPAAARHDALGVSVVGGARKAEPPRNGETRLTESSEEKKDASPGLPQVLASPPTQPGAVPAELAAYALAVRQRIGATLRYPLALRRRGVHGRVGLRLVLNAEGQIQKREVSEPSGSAELDELALEAAQTAQPYPAPSSELRKQGQFVLNLPVEFKLH